MERLTKHGKPDHKTIMYSGKDTTDIVIKLAAYEDTGLTPEEINEHEEIFEAYRHVCGGKSPEEIEKLQQECDYWHREAIKWAGKLGEHRIKFRKLLNDFGIPESDFPPGSRI